MSGLFSIVIPVHNRAALTRQCLDAIFADPPEADHEIIVVDDASVDSTADVLASYGDRVQALALPSNEGFAAACNKGAGSASGDNLIFLNNDTIPQPGWLDALAAYADSHPEAAVVGSKLLFPNDTIQHAGVVICQDGNPRHLYAGFPADHPAVNRSRRFQAVTAACALVRRNEFDQVGGFDLVFRNCLEDADLCLRLGERGRQIHYCHESVLYHLESISRGRRSKEIERNARIFRNRWGGRVEPDDLRYYIEDGLLRVQYQDAYPVRLQISPDLAIVDGDDRWLEGERLLGARSRQVLDLLRETVRLTAHIADLELHGQRHAVPVSVASVAREGPREGGEVDHDQLLRRAREIELEIHDFQSELAATLAENGSEQRPKTGSGVFVPSEYLAYRRLLSRIREIVPEHLPPDATVIVASRGDDELLSLGGLRGWHFPQEPDGTYAGHYPADSATAIAQLERLRSRGADYLLLPNTALWWLDHYADFGRHVKDRYPAVVAEQDTCMIFRLKPSEADH